MTPDNTCLSSSRGDTASLAVSSRRTRQRDAAADADEQFACDLAALMQLGLVDLFADGADELRVEARDDD